MAGKIDQKDKKRIQQLANTVADQRKSKSKAEQAVSTVLATAQKRGLTPTVKKKADPTALQPGRALNNMNSMFHMGYRDYVEQRQEQEQEQARADAMARLLGESGYKNIAGQAVFVTPNSPLPKPTAENTASLMQAPGAYGIKPQDFAQAMADIKAFKGMKKPEPVVEAPEVDFISKWFPDADYEPSAMDMMDKADELEGAQLEEYYADYEAYVANADKVRDNEQTAREYDRAYPEAQAKYDAAIKLLGEDALNYLNETPADYYGRYANLHNSHGKDQNAITLNKSDVVRQFERALAKDGIPGVGTSYGFSLEEARQWMGRYGENDPNRIADIERWSQTTPEERSTYNHIKTLYGEDAAQSYFESMYPELNRRVAQETEELARNDAEQNPVLSSALTIIGAPERGAKFGWAAVEKAFGKDVDANDPRLNPTRYSDTVRETVQEDMGKVGKLLYSTGMSIGDNVVNRLTFGPFGKAGTWAQSGNMGLSSAASGYIDTSERTGDDNQAWNAALASGLVEMLFEKFSIENLNALKAKDVKTARDFVVNMLKQMGTEGSEEFFTGVANEILDRTIMGDQSNYELAVDYYMSQGYSEEDARKQANKDSRKEIRMGAYGGMISGGVMGGGQQGLSLLGARSRNNAQQQTAQTMQQAEETQEDPLRAAAEIRAEQEIAEERGETPDASLVEEYEQDTPAQRVDERPAAQTPAATPAESYYERRSREDSDMMRRVQERAEAANRAAGGSSFQGGQEGQEFNPYNYTYSNPWAQPATNAQPAQNSTQPAQTTTNTQTERTQPAKSEPVDNSDRSNAKKITGASFMNDIQAVSPVRLRGGKELAVTDVYRDNGVLRIVGQNKKGNTASSQITSMDIGDSRTARLLKSINNHGTALGYGDNSAVEINECIKNYDSERGTMDEYVSDFSKVYQYAQMGMTPEEIKADYAYKDHLNDKAFDAAYKLGTEKAPEVEFKSQDQQREEAAEAYRKSGQKPENAIEFADDSLFNAGTVKMDNGKSGDLTPVALSTNENGERVVTAIDSKGKTHTAKLGSVQFKDEAAQTLFGKFWIDTFDIDQQRGNGGMADRLTDEALPAYIDGFDADRVSGAELDDKVSAYAKEFYRVYKAGERGQTLEQMADGDEKILDRIHKVLSQETIDKAYKAGQNTPEAQRQRRLQELNAPKTAQPAAQTAQPAAETKAEKPATTRTNPWAAKPAQETGSKSEARAEAKADEERTAQDFRTKHTATVTDEYGDQHTVQVVGVESVEKDAVVLHVVDENGQDDYCLSSDLEFGNDMDELLDYSGISRLSERGVRAYLDGYDSSLASPAEYANAFAGVYERGRVGMDYIQAVANSEAAQMFLTSEAARSAYNAGTAMSNAENDVMVGKSARFQKRILDALGKKTGVKFKLTNKDIGANAYYRPSTNEIVVSTKADKGAFIYAAVHEMGHQLKAKGSMEAWASFSELIQETLEKNGVNIEERINAAMEQYKGVMDAEGITDPDERWEYAWEEVVCNSAASFLQDDAVLQDLVAQDRTLMQQVADYIRQFLDDLTQTIRSLGKDMSELNGWKQMEAMKNDHKSLQNIYESLTGALAQTNGQEQQQTKQDVKLSAKEEGYYDYSKSFAEQVEDLRAGRFPEKNALLVSGTPEVLQKIGFSNLPLMINQDHLMRMERDTEHYLSKEMIRQLPELLKDPVAVITSTSEGSEDSSIVMILKAIVNGKPYIAPVYITSESRTYNARIDSNNIATVFRKGNAVSKLLEDAVQKENADKIGVYYWKKTEARNLFEGAGVQFSGSSIQDGLIHSIHDAGSPVNRKYMEQTETKQFKRWFGDSQIVNEDGSPKVVYHGTASEFWTFDKKKANDMIGRRMGLGAGKDKFYLTEHKGSGNAAAYSAQGAGKGNQPKVMELYVSAQKVMDRSEYDRRLKELFAKYPNSDPRGAAYDYKQRDKAIAQLDKAIRKEGYDGVWDKDSGELFVYESTQIKSATDNVGTFDSKNPDIRFSMKETVEETRDMLAVHNLTEENMRNAMELGGLAMPSIAVIKAEQGHSQYGTISVIFDKSTIDPEASRDNEIYGGDAWTPTFPHVEYEVDEAVESRIMSKYQQLRDKVGGDMSRVMYGYANDLQHKIDNAGSVEKMVESLQDDTNMMQLYLADKGKETVQPVVKRTVTRMEQKQIDEAETLVKKLGADVIRSYRPMDSKGWMEKHGADLADAYEEALANVHGFDAEDIQLIMEDPYWTDAKKALRNAYRYLRDGAEKVSEETDSQATRDKIRNEVDQKDYQKWLNDLFAGAVKGKGIRNDVNTFTPSGKRRSFKQTHWDVTLDNVVKAMRKEEKTGIGTLGRSIEGAAVKKYKSIKDVKTDSGRLQKIDQAEYDAMRKDFRDRFSSIAREYANGKDQFDAGDALVEYITKNATADGIYKQMAKNAAFYKPSRQVAEELAALVDEMKNAPTGYFEAKPRRAVGFEEMAAVIVPDNLSDDVRANLENAGVNVIEYEAGNDEDRKAKMNSEAVDKLKFSMRDTDENVQDALTAEQKAFEQVKGHRITAAEADKLAGAILKQANSDYDQQKLAAELSRIYDYIERGEDVDWAQVDDEKTALMARVMEKSKALNLEHEEMAQPIRDYFKRVKISLSDSQRSEAANLADGIGAYRRMLFGSVRLANSGTGLETAWSELSELNPELFPADANETDMPALLLQAVDAIKPVYDSGMGMNVEESATWLAGKMDEAYFGLPAVKAAAQSARTFGDSVVALKNAMKRFEESSWSEYQNALRSIKEAKSDQQKTQKQQELAALRKKYQQWREKDTAARKEREMKAKYRAKTERTVKTLTTWLNKPTDAKHVPAEVENTMRKMLTSLDFSGKTTKTATELSDQLNSLADALLNAQEGEDENRTIFLERDQQMIDEIKRVAELIRGNAVYQQREGRGVYDLSGAEMRELSKWLDVVKHVVTKAGTMRGSNLPGESVEQVAAASMEEIRRKTPHKDKKWITKEWNKHFGVDMQDSFAFFERLGNTSNAVFKELRKGFDKMASLVADAEKHTKTILDGADLKHMTGKHAKKQSFQLQSGEVELTKAQIMEMYVLSKREQAQGHLYGGGFRLIGDENARPYTISKAELTAITDTLTKDEKRIADGMQRFLSKECANWGNQASMELLGYRKFGEENYWPISTDANSRNTTKLEDNYAANISAIKNQGMTKALTEGAKNAIMIGDIFDTYTRHISNMSAYSAYALPLSDFTRWYNSRGVKTEIEHALGKDGLKYINNFLMAVNGSALQAEKSGLSKAAGVLTRNAKIASVGANMRVVVQQPTSYARAAMYISPKYLSEALVMKKPDEDLVNKYCGIAQWKRWGFYETNVGPNLRQLIVGDTSFADKTREVMMKPAAMGDNWTLNHLWNACEMETREVYPELERGSDEYYKQVGARMSEIIDRTQVVDSVFHRSQMMRSKNPMDQMLTNFMSEPTKTYNMLMSAISEYADNRRNKAARNRLARAFTVYGVTGLMTAAAAAVVDAFRDDDEEKEWLEKYTDAVKSNAVDNLNPIGMLPGVKDVLSLLQGYEASRLDQQSIQRIVWAAQEIKKYTEGESKLNLYGVTYKTSQALSSLLGIPASNIMRDANAIIQTVTGYSPTSSAEARKNNTVSRLFAAMKSGTKEDAQKLREELLSEKVGMTNKEIDTALAAHLANDPKVIEAWTAKQEKRFADANRAHNALTARGFDHEMVDKAIQAYGNSVTPKEPREKDPNAVLNVTLYSTEEVASAIRIMAGVEQGGSVTEADIRSMISDRVAGSSAADPEKNVMNAIQTELKPGYLEAVKNGDTTKANALGSAMRNVLGTTTEAMNKWVVDSLKGEYVTAAKSSDSRKTTRLMNSLKKYGGVTQATMETWVTDSYRDDLRTSIDAFNTTSAKKVVSKLRSYGVEDKSIQGSLSKYKQQYIDAYRRGDRVTASKIKSTLMGLGLKYADSGNPMYTDATFEKWLK